MIYISLFVKNILMQMNLLTEKLKQVEVGDLTVQIYKMPKNEFAYVFRQFNHMVRRTHELLEATVKNRNFETKQKCGSCSFRSTRIFCTTAFPSLSPRRTIPMP